MSFIGIIIPVGRWVYVGGEYPDKHGDWRHTMNPLRSLCDYPDLMGFQTMPMPEQLVDRFVRITQSIQDGAEVEAGNYNAKQENPMMRVDRVEVDVQHIELFVFNDRFIVPAPKTFSPELWGRNADEQPPVAHFRFDGSVCMQVDDV